MQLKNQADCSKPTPHFTTSASVMLCLRSSSALAATYSLDHSTPIAGGLNGNGKYAKAKRELPFACPCRSKGKRKPMPPKMTWQNHKHAMPSGFGRIGLCSHRPREKTPSFRRSPD